MDNKPKDIHPTTDIDKSERGRQSYAEGYAFEEQVAELFRLLHYEVEHSRLFSGRQVDLFVTTRLGDLTVHRAIECKAGPVKTDHIDSFIAKLQLVRLEFPSAIGTIISASTFTDAVKSHAAKIGIKLTFYRDLQAQLLDGHTYVSNLLREFKTNTNYPVNYYIEPFIGYDTVGEGIRAFNILESWLDDPEWSQLTLLGDVGTGKSFFSRMIAKKLATEYLKNSLENPIPILVDLRNADREFSLEGLVLTHLARNGLSQISFDIFQHVLTQGRIVLILDGFDEMAARVTPQITNRNFHELSRSVHGRAKILLTCRTHYFKSRTEEEEVILGSRDDYGSEPARELYWELISRKGFRIAYLRPFNISQIEEYVRLVRPDCAKDAIKKIRTTYNLEELSQRPMLLEMIVKSIDKLNAAEINQSTLYKVFTDAWIHRDKWRDVLSPEIKLNFLTALARSLWQEDLNNIHYSRLNEYVRQELAAQIQDTQQLFEIDNEIRTASFLTRDDTGRYGFAHKSYLEFFLARQLATQLTLGNIDCLNTRRLHPEIIGFLLYLIDLTSIEPILESILVREYRPFISENALLCLYGFRRYQALDQDGDKALKILLPNNMLLSGAQLDQVTLEGAVLSGVDFVNTNLEQAILSSADLSGANLTGANLVKADLKRARLCSTKMSCAQLTGAYLEDANLSFSSLEGANLTDAYLLNTIYVNTIFDRADFTRAVLSDELTEHLSTVLNLPQFREKFGLSNSLEANHYWNIFQQLRPMILRSATYAAWTYGPDSEDIASEVAFRIIRSKKLEELMEWNESAQQRYVSTLAKNIMLEQRQRREQNFGILEDVDSTSMTKDDIRAIKNATSIVPDPFDEVHAAELRQKIREILPDDLWHTFEFINEHGLSLAEVALEEGVSTRTVHRRLTKAREVIKRELFPGFISK